MTWPAVTHVPTTNFDWHTTRRLTHRAHSTQQGLRTLVCEGYLRRREVGRSLPHPRHPGPGPQNSTPHSGWRRIAFQGHLCSQTHTANANYAHTQPLSQYEQPTLPHTQVWCWLRSPPPPILSVLRRNGSLRVAAAFSSDDHSLSGILSTHSSAKSASWKLRCRNW